MSPLEQLKSVLCDPDGKCCITGSDDDRAIVDRALQALAQPEEDFCYCDDSISLQIVSGGAAVGGLYYRVRLKIDGEYVDYVREQPEQEPVATKTDKGITLHTGWDNLPADTPLYTSPPAREWVWLTDAQVIELRLATPSTAEQWGNTLSIAKALNNKLKELNT
jgi:hypothetical protein